jgi:DNA-binding transcriptional LysR family regulator
MFDLAKLQAFLQAAEGLNFSEAARRLHLSQPTLSRHIQRLERELGVELFTRSERDLKLTEAGRLLLPQARKLIREAVEIQQLMDSFQDKIVGHIRIACSTTAGKYLLPQFAARFRRRHPGVRVSILGCTQEHVVPRLLEEEADLGVVSYEACGGELDCQEFFRDHIVLIVPADHPWTSSPSIEPTELLTTPFIIREPTSGTRKVLLAELSGHDISLEDMDIFLEVGNAEAIVRTIEAGFGVSFVSRLATTWALDRGTVVEVPVAGFDLRRTIHMVRNTMHPANRAVEAFWGFVHDPANADLLRLAEA